MRSVNSIRGSDDSEVLTSMNDRTLIQLLFSDALTLKKHQLTFRVRREFQMRTCRLDTRTLKFKTERHV